MTFLHSVPKWLLRNILNIEHQDAYYRAKKVNWGEKWVVLISKISIITWFSNLSYTLDHAWHCKLCSCTEKKTIKFQQFMCKYVLGVYVWCIRVYEWWCSHAIAHTRAQRTAWNILTFFFSRWDSIIWLFFCNYIRLASLWTSIEPLSFVAHLSKDTLRVHLCRYVLHDSFHSCVGSGNSTKWPLCGKHFHPLSCLPRLRQFLTETRWSQFKGCVLFTKAMSSGNIKCA